MGHEEHVLVAILLQHRGDTLAAWSYCSLHQVSEHESREAVERSRHAMVGMDAGTIKVGERQGMMIERIERWGERLLIAECTQQVCRHRLHQYHHYVRMILLRRRLAHLHHQGIVHHLTLQNIRAIYNQIVGDYSISANVGANIMRNHYEYVYGLTQGGLAIPEYYNLANSLQAAKAYNYKRVKGINSLFGDITLGWKNMLYLEATIRGDKSSSLPSSNNTYVYPSVTGSWLFSELLKDKAPWLTYGKVRLGFAKVCLLPQPARMHTQ